MTNSLDHPDIAIGVRDLRMRYGDLDVLRGFDFDIRRGEVVTLLGPNGAGKTTTIEILEGLRGRSGGDVRVLGQDPARVDDAWRARIGIVIQSWRDHARWTPRELLDYLGSLYAPYSTPQRPTPRLTAELISAVGLEEKADAKIRLLSGGQRRRLDVAVGILGRPEVLFLDEPTAGLDPEARRHFHDLVHELVDEDGTTVLLTTHDLAEAEALADRVMILSGGRIVADSSADALSDYLERDTQVRWRLDSVVQVHATRDATRFVRDLLCGPDGERVTGLEVRRPTLEDSYMALVAPEPSAATAMEEAR